MDPSPSDLGPHKQAGVTGHLAFYLGPLNVKILIALTISPRDLELLGTLICRVLAQICITYHFIL